MSAEQIAGAILVTAPFIAIFAFAVWEFGILEALGLFAACAALIGVISLGTTLLEGGAA